ncbi:MAG: hypothetical protein J3R72DRAFT_434143, partial [Linnemannia gamsii]
MMLIILCFCVLMCFVAVLCLWRSGETVERCYFVHDLLDGAEAIHAEEIAAGGFSVFVFCAICDTLLEIERASSRKACLSWA